MSIDHILKTAFKDVLDEDIRLQNADVARKGCIDYLEQDKAIQASLELKLKEFSEQETSLLTQIEESKGPKAKKPPPPKKGEVPGLTPTELLEQQLQHLQAQRQEELDVVARRPKAVEVFPLASYKSRFQKLELDSNFKNNYDVRASNIEKEITESKKDANSLADFLVDKREQAHDLEVEEEDKLKRQGIIVGQHIPSLKSLVVSRQIALVSPLLPLL